MWSQLPEYALCLVAVPCQNLTLGAGVAVGDALGLQGCIPPGTHWCLSWDHRTLGHELPISGNQGVATESACTDKRPLDLEGKKVDEIKNEHPVPQKARGQN